MNASVDSVFPEKYRILSGSALKMIAVITILRALTLNQVPKKTFLVLWALALVRLLVPFSLPSRLSVYTLLARQAPAVSDATAVSPPPVLPAAPVTVMPQVTAPSASTVSPWAVVWLVGSEVWNSR